MRRITSIAIAALTAALAFTFANDPAEAGGGCHSESSATHRDHRRAHQELLRAHCRPSPAGDHVTLTNNDPDIHAVTGVANTWGN